MLAYRFLRPALFCLSAETAHHVSLWALKWAVKMGFVRVNTPAQNVTYCGLSFTNRVGLAAGLDKNGDYIDALAALGFGFIEIGTVTPRPQVGNPKPRLFRLVQQQALINRMGFNNKGVDYLVAQVKKAKFRGVLGINIGKNKDTPLEEAVDDYLLCLQKVYAVASYVTINISSPNTEGLRGLQEGEALEGLLKALHQERLMLTKTRNKTVPLWVKIAPDMDAQQIDYVAKMCIKYEMDGMIATNTTFSREGVEGHRHSSETGGLSGKPLTEMNTQVVTQLVKALNGKIPVIALGGIDDVASAQAKRDAGAALVQIYTGLIYQGPGLVKTIVDELQ